MDACAHSSLYKFSERERHTQGEGERKREREREQTRACSIVKHSAGESSACFVTSASSTHVQAKGTHDEPISRTTCWVCFDLASKMVPNFRERSSCLNILTRQT